MIESTDPLVVRHDAGHDASTRGQHNYIGLSSVELAQIRGRDLVRMTGRTRRNDKLVELVILPNEVMDAIALEWCKARGLIPGCGEHGS